MPRHTTTTGSSGHRHVTLWPGLGEWSIYNWLRIKVMPPCGSTRLPDPSTRSCPATCRAQAPRVCGKCSRRWRRSCGVTSTATTIVVEDQGRRAVVNRPSGANQVNSLARMRPSTKDLSVVLGCYNAGNDLETHVRDLLQALESLKRPYELLLVDD